MSERQGIEIDYCPVCRGVWLDRGELDKIIERVQQQPKPPMAAAPGQPPAQPALERRPHGHDDSSGRWTRGGKRKSWLSELFD